LQEVYARKMTINRAVQARRIAVVTFAVMTALIVVIFGGIYLWKWFVSRLLW